MEFKGTPGPWAASEIYNFSDTLVAYIWSETNNKHVAQLRGCTTGDEEKAEANAKLIASSPELLDMVNSLYNLLEEHQPNWYTMGHHKQIQSLLKKATE